MMLTCTSFRHARWIALLLSVSYCLLEVTTSLAQPQPTKSLIQASDFSLQEKTSAEWETLRQSYPDWKAISLTELAKIRHELQSSEATPSQPSTGYHIENLTFSATLTKQALQGTLRLEIAGKATEKQWLNLSPWPFLTESPVVAEGDKKPFHWGLNAAGQPLLEVERPGSYAWPVTLFNADPTGKTLQFRCDTVPALARRFELIVPNQYVVVPRKAVLVETNIVDLETTRWIFQAPGQDAVEFQFTPQQASSSFKPQLLLRPNVTYEIGTGGLQIHWESRWENQPNTIQELTIRLPQEVKLLTVQWGDQLLIPRQISREKVAQSEYRLSLPARTPGSSPSLRIHAATALILDELRELPMLQIDHQQLQDFNYQLVTALPYELAQITLQDCRISASEKLLEPLSGRALRFQLTGPNPRIQTLTRWSQVQGNWSSQLELTPTASTLQAKWQAVVQVEQGESDVCEFSIDPQWLVADFQLDPPQLLREFQRIEQPASATLYRAQFQRKLLAGDQFQITCLASIPVTGKRWQLPWEHLDLCQLLQWRRKQSLLVLPPVTTGNWKLPQQTGLQPLSEQAWQLIPFKLQTKPSETTVVSYQQLPSGNHLEFAQHTVDLPIEIRNEYTLTAESLIEHLKINITPRTRTQVLPRHLYVYHPQTPRYPLTWFSKQDPQQPLPARQIPVAERAANFPQTGDLWMIQLPPLNNQQLIIQATRTLPFAKEYELQGWQILEQSAVNSQFSVWSQSPDLPNIVTEKLLQTTATTTLDNDQLLIGTWKMSNPAEKNALLSIKRTIQQSHQPVIHMALLETFCQPAQSLHHQFQAQVYSELPTAYRFQLSTGRKLTAVTLNGHSVDHRWLHELQQYEIAIPGKRELQIIKLNWHETEEQSNWFPTAVAEWPVSPWPILNKKWLVICPTSCQPSKTNLLTSSPAVTWQKMFLDRVLHPVQPAWNQSRWWLEPYLPFNNSTSNSELSAEILVQFWQQLSAIPTANSSNWNDAIQTFLAAINQQRRLYLDEQMLAKYHLPTEPEHAAALVLIAWEENFILTTWERLAELDQVTPHPSLVRLYYANTDRFTTSEDLNASLIRVTTWTETWLWPSSSPSTHRAAIPQSVLPGWVPYAVHETATGTSLCFVEQAKLRVCCLGLYVVSLVLSIFWLTWSATRKLITICLLGLGIALVPIGWAPLLVAVLWGLFTGQILRWFACWPWSGWFANDPLLQRTRHVSGRVTSKLAISTIWLVILLSGVALYAQPTVTTTAIKPIFIIKDSSAEKSGTAYVPPELMDRLQSAVTNSAATWLIQSATYTGKLEQTAEQLLRPVNWTAQLQGTNLLPKQWVRFNFTAQQIAVLPNGIHVNQQPVAWRWSKNTSELELQLNEIGPQQIEIRFLPILENTRTGIPWNWQIPAAPRNEFRLTTTPGIRLATPLAGTWNWQAEQHQLHGFTGPTTQFPILWQIETSTDTRVQTETEISSWLKIRPGYSQLDLRIPIRVMNGQLQRIQLAVDERLELLAPTNDTTMNWQASKQGNTLDIDFKNAITDRTVLDLSFAVKPSTDHTNWSMPKVELLGQVIKNQWLLVSVDSLLELKENLKPQGLIASDLETFRRIWGTDATRPALNYQVVRPNYFWRFQTTPRNTQYQNRLAQAWQLYGTEYCAWGLVNRVEILQGSTWTLTTKCAPDWIPYQVQVQQQAETIPCHWGLGKSGELTIFFDNPIYGEVQIKLLGQRKIAAKSPLQWTWLAWENQSPKQVELLVARDQETALQLTWPNKLTAVPREEWPNWQQYWPADYWQQQLQSSQPYFPTQFLRGTTTEQAVVARSTTNQMQGTTHLQTQIEKRQNTWWINLQGAITLKQGTLDELELLIGVPISATTLLESSSQVRVLAAPDSDQTRLLIQPTRLDNQRFQFQCSLPINQPLNQPLKWSATQLINSKLKLTEQLYLPTRQQAVPNWSLTDLTPLTPNSDTPANSWPYQVTSALAQAVERNFSPTQNQTRCLLVNHQLILTTQQSWGVSEFDLLTGSAQALRIWLPAGLEWIHDQVDFQQLPWQKAEIPETERALIAPLVGGALDGTLWEVPVAPHSAQRIIIAYRDTRTTAQIAQQPCTPLLVDLTAEQTEYQWQLDSVDHALETDVLAVAQSLLVQLQALDQILNWHLQQSNSTINAAPSQPLELWIQRWQQCWQRLNTTLSKTRSASINSDELNKIEQQRQEQLAITTQNLGQDPRFYVSSSQHTSDSFPVLSHFQPIFAAKQLTSAHDYYAHLIRPATRNWQHFWFAILGLLFTAGFGLIAYRTGWGNLPGRYPLLTLTVIALVWWCWFTPREISILLLIIVGLNYWLKHRKFVAETDFTVQAANA